MLGFNAFSDLAISDISLPVITGTIYVTDSNDTANLTSQVLVQGSINTTDQDDFAVISGEDRVDGYIQATDGTDTATLTGSSVVAGQILTLDGDDTADIEAFATQPTGYIYAEDSNDTSIIIGVVSGEEPTMDMHDGFKKEDLKRIRDLQKRLKKAEEKRNQLRILKIKERKDAIANAVDPKKVALKQQPVVESPQEVEIDKPSIDLREINAVIANLERQKDQLLKSIALKQEMARIQTELTILEAKRKAELDDEEALLLLM